MLLKKKKRNKELRLLLIHNLKITLIIYVAVSKAYPEEHCFVLQRVDTFKRGHHYVMFFVLEKLLGIYVHSRVKQQISRLTVHASICFKMYKLR